MAEAEPSNLSQDDPTLAPMAGKLCFRTKFFFGLGYFAEAVGLFAVTSYTMLYYNQVLGLPAALAGLALSISLLADGPADLLMGSISDRTKSRFGRRHLYMYLAPLPIALSFYAIFNPPTGLDQTGLFVWLLVSVVALRQFMNVFHTPHAALGGELSSDYQERTRVMAYGSFATALGATAQSWIALSFFFRATPEYPQGLLNPAPWSSFGLTLALIVFSCLYLSGWCTRDRIPYLPQPPEGQPRFSVREFWRDVVMAFSNRNFALLIVGYFCLTMTTGLRSGLQIYTSTYFWGLTSEQLRWIFLTSVLGSVIAFFTTHRLQRRLDKKLTIIAASIVQAIAPAIPTTLGILGLLRPDFPYLVPFMVTFAVIGWAAYGILTISVLSAVADVADENDLRYGVRQEGVMYAMRNMFGKIDQAIGAAAAGMILTLIAFPVRAKVGEVERETVLAIAMSDAWLATLPGLVAIIPYLYYRLSREDHARTQAAILQRNKAQASSEVL